MKTDNDCEGKDMKDDIEKLKISLNFFKSIKYIENEQLHKKHERYMKEKRAQIQILNDKLGEIEGKL